MKKLLVVAVLVAAGTLVAKKIQESNSQKQVWDQGTDKVT